MPLFCPLQECSIVKLQSVSHTTHSVAAEHLHILTPVPSGCCSLILCRACSSCVRYHALSHVRSILKSTW